MTRRLQMQRAVLRTGWLLNALRVEQFSRAMPPGAWMPAMNVYRYPDHYELVVELAGVDPADLTIQVVDEHRIRISGYRRWPELRCSQTGAACQRTSLLEIEDGRFAREVELAQSDRISTVQVDFRDGLVWIRATLANSRKPIRTKTNAHKITSKAVEDHNQEKARDR